MYSFSNFHNFEYGAEVKLMTKLMNKNILLFMFFSKYEFKMIKSFFKRCAIINDVNFHKLALYDKFSCSKKVFNYFVGCGNDSIV